MVSTAYEENVCIRSNVDPHSEDANSIATDCQLPADIDFPSLGAHAPYRKVLLTGATGFLGAQILKELLRKKDIEILCLVRASNAALANRRLIKALSQAGQRFTSLPPHVCALPGALGDPLLGMSRREYEKTCARPDAIIHCAAQVDWAASYDDLRRSNVAGVVDLLRVAASDPAKEFYFISSAAACYLFPGCGAISEVEPLAARVQSMRLPYARSKLVGEELVREAGRRGLSAKIFRPSIILGDSSSGTLNRSDIVFRMLKTCVRMGYAPDIDLVLDYCPVDFVAKAIIALSSRPAQGIKTYHLLNPNSIRWSELVLGLNLFGYSIRFLPTTEWLERLASEFEDTRHPLYPLRRFFLEPLGSLDGLTHFQLYEYGRTTRPGDESTLRSLERLNIRCPGLDAELMERYINWMVEHRHLPKPALRRVATHDALALSSENLEKLAQSAMPSGLSRIVSSKRVDLDSSGGLTSAVVRWKYGSHIGLSSYSITAIGSDGEQSQLRMIIKAKPLEYELRESLAAAAQICDDNIGAALSSLPQLPGFTGSTSREAEVYRLSHPTFRRYLPRFYGTLPRTGSRTVFAIEDVSCTQFLTAKQRMAPWGPELAEDVICAIAQLHAVWYAREKELAQKPWLDNGQAMRAMMDAWPLWRALADFAGMQFSLWTSSAIGNLMHSYVASLADWWPMVEMHRRTLIHNDLNPRNIAFRAASDGRRVCIYDWELSSVGLPQRDLAEFLCFVLRPEDVVHRAPHLVELHRTELQDYSGHHIDRQAWREGLGLALRELLISRLPMYAIVHRFRPESVLPRAVAVWRQLQKQFCLDPTEMELAAT